MAIKLVPLTCPSCGATIDAPVDQDYCFCTYCGTKLAIDDDVLRIEINRTVNKTKHIIDDAAVAEAKHKSLIVKIIAFIAVIVIVGVGILMYMAMHENFDAQMILLFLFLIVFAVVMGIFDKNKD